MALTLGDAKVKVIIDTTDAEEELKELEELAEEIAEQREKERKEVQKVQKSQTDIDRRAAVATRQPARFGVAGRVLGAAASVASQFALQSTIFAAQLTGPGAASVFFAPARRFALAAAQTSQAVSAGFRAAAIGEEFGPVLAVALRAVDDKLEPVARIVENVSDEFTALKAKVETFVPSVQRTFEIAQAHVMLGGQLSNDQAIDVFKGIRAFREMQVQREFEFRKQVRGKAAETVIMAVKEATSK